MTDYKNKKIAVLGLGIEGRDAINFLLQKGGAVTLFDKKNEAELDFTGIDKTKIKFILGEKYLDKGLKDFDYIVRSPGVYRYISEIKEAENSGVKVTSAIKIFFEECPGRIIGVTGTKGKGTTSTLIYEILKASGKDTYLSGNIGKPYLELLDTLSTESWVVMEMSSFQLIDMEVSPHIAVVLNITEDHLDWHVSRDEYVHSKENVVKYQKDSDFAVINEEYKVCKNFADIIKGKIVFFSKNTLEDKFKQGLLLRGEHNLENIAAAVSAARCVGVSDEIIFNTVKSFKGLEHRLELVGEFEGIKYYNDSFATGPQPTIAAINSFTEPETLILGGSDKGLNYGELGKVIKSRSNIKSIILIGSTAEKIRFSFSGENNRFTVYNLGSSSMTEIVKKAREVSEKGGVVILSPASASFDMFKNYKDRGNQFKEAVQSLHESK